MHDHYKFYVKQSKYNKNYANRKGFAKTFSWLRKYNCKRKHNLVLFPARESKVRSAFKFVSPILRHLLPARIQYIIRGHFPFAFSVCTMNPRIILWCACTSSIHQSSTNMIRISNDVQVRDILKYEQIQCSKVLQI